MTFPRSFRWRLGWSAGLSLTSIGLAVALISMGQASQPPGSTPVAGQGSGPGDRPSDKEEVQKALSRFVSAFQSGDAKAVADCWTAEGEYISDDGETFRGRTALEKSYSEFFINYPGNQLEVEVETIRFPSRDNAILEGHFKLHMGKKRELVVSRCSFLYAREDGKWLIAIAREWPGDGLEIRDLEWLIGTWESRRDETVVTTEYAWSTNKTFIRCKFSITQNGRTSTGTQIIGKMPSTGGLHMWTFEDAGGIGDSDFTREGKKWINSARGSTADGNVITATNIITPIDADSFLWQSGERTLDGEPLPDLPPIKVVRVKSK